MLLLHRPLHDSASVQLGASRNTPVLAQYAEEASVHPLQAALSTVFPPEAVPVSPQLCPPTDPHPVIGRLRLRQTVSSCLPVNPREHLRQLPRAQLHSTIMKNICSSEPGGASSPCLKSGDSTLALVEWEQLPCA